MNIHIEKRIYIGCLITPGHHELAWKLCERVSRFGGAITVMVQTVVLDNGYVCHTRDAYLVERG